MPGRKRQNKGTQSTKTKKAKPNTKNIKIAQRSEEESQALLYDGFQQLFNGRESVECMLNRKENFKECWNRVNEAITSILLDMNQSAVERICDFVDKDHDMNDSLIKLPFHEIPTGLVFAGINTPDHGTQFAHIASKLQEAPTAENKRKKKDFVALLQSKNCLNIKSMIKSMIERFLANEKDVSGHDTGFGDNEDDNEDDAEDDEDMIRVTEQRQAAMYKLGNGAATAKPSKCLPYDMQLLEGWYKYQTNHSNSSPNLVVILQDFESFEPTVVQDFFTICSEYRSRLPIVCIVGIATSTEILHQSLSKSTIGLLRIEKFTLEQSEVWFNRVIEEIFLDSTTTIKFGARSYKFLLDHFYLYDYSISKATASLKVNPSFLIQHQFIDQRLSQYAYMHHFYGNPLSIFLPLMQHDKSKMQDCLTEWLTKEVLNEHHITHIRMLKSFRAYIESIAPTEPKKALRLLEEDRYLITEVVPDLLDDIKVYQQEFRMGINLLVLLQAQFPSFTSFSNLRKSKRLLLLEALGSNERFSKKGDLVKSLVILIRKIDERHVGRLLTELRQFLEGIEYREISASAIKQLDEWQERFDQLAQGSEHHAARANVNLKGMLLPDVQESRATATSKKVQTQSIEHLKRKGSEASKIAMSIAEWVETVLAHHLRSFTNLPLHEMIYYTNIQLHEKSFASQPRAAVQTALTQPQHYMYCSCCHTEKSDQILSSEHDTCILYKLYLECGRMINLYDWFVAFGCIVEREKRSPHQKLEENEVQARFIRSVAELQFLGFIKPTQRKTDHVIRLTWSNI
ncbi:origin recognition complex subunit 3-like [Mucor ambiguus]|uniref:Origin recognition complex subunit 3 n=1 Tax=Mucor ambiguus TaxID=91626 RepID=A0A0C9N916_9FUNG|nr:origin recognition complex subunit 3-like [Mucor ambiguus]